MKTRTIKKTFTSGQCKGTIGVFDILKRLNLKNAPAIRFRKYQHGEPGFPDTYLVDIQDR